MHRPCRGAAAAADDSAASFSGSAAAMMRRFDRFFSTRTDHAINQPIHQSMDGRYPRLVPHSLSVERGMFGAAVRVFYMPRCDFRLAVFYPHGPRRNKFLTLSIDLDREFHMLRYVKATIKTAEEYLFIWHSVIARLLESNFGVCASSASLHGSSTP